ncbi:MAG: cytochrome c oxidase subunit II [Gammaproteobacteria bacterium]
MANCRWFSAVIAIVASFFCSMPIFAADLGMNMPKGVTPVSHEIYTLHMITLYICIVIGVLVFTALFYSLIKYRKSKGVKAAHFHEHLGVELVWTIVPFLILVGLAIPATKVLMQIHDTARSDLTIKVVGYQWKWKYEYLDYGISFMSNLSTPQEQIQRPTGPKNDWFLLEVDNPLVVPVKKKVKLLVTADDVVHSWWVPDLAVKQDAIPGYVNENWFYIEKPGIYRGQCGELCGAYHGFMPIVVKALPQEEFDSWIQKHNKKHQNEITKKVVPMVPLSKDALMAKGEKVYGTSCALCHQKNGEGMPPAFPALKGSAIATGPVADNISIVVHGKKGTAMQAFGEQLDNEQLAAVITYVRNAWGNDAINEKNKQTLLVQPRDVEKAK